MIVPVMGLKVWWPKARELVLSAERRWKGETEEQIVAQLLQDQYKLCIVHEEGVPSVAATLEIVKLPEATVGVIRQLGGDFQAWFPHKDFFVSWLTAFGAERLMMTGRRGWARKLRPLGFTEKFVTMEVDLGRWK